MSAGLSFDLRQLEAIADQLDAAAAQGRDMTVLMDRIGMAMETTTEERFEQEQAPDGSKWTPSLRAKEDGGKTLTLTGRLSNSITHLARADSVEVGTNLIYAGVHQFGATIRAKTDRGLAFKLPGIGFVRPMSVVIGARPFIGIGGDDEETIAELAEDFFLEPFAEAA